jgi:hypothetical protein
MDSQRFLMSSVPKETSEKTGPTMEEHQELHRQLKAAKQNTNGHEKDAEAGDAQASNP